MLKLRILLLAVCPIFTGCVTLYKPNVVHSPLLKEKDDLHVAASLGLSGSGLSNLQGAYAITDHAGIMANGMHHQRKLTSLDSSATQSEHLRILFAEAGAGYYSTFGNEKDGLFQCYGGGGYGETNDRIEGLGHPMPEVKAKYFNVFIQPGVAFTSKRVELAFDLRGNYVRLFNIHAYLYNEFDWWNTDLNFYSDTAVSFLNMEPAITIKAGGEKLKGILQFGVTIPTIHAKSYFAVNNGSLLLVPLIKFSVGVTYAFKRRGEGKRAAPAN